MVMQLLEGPLTSPPRLSDALRSKFVRRLSGFYRCSTEEKGFFAHLAWVPEHLPYLQPACQLYTLLLSHEEGINFLKTDRRGKILPGIAAALQLEAQTAVAEGSGKGGMGDGGGHGHSHGGDGGGGGGGGAAGAGAGERLFTRHSCECTMVREYFTLIGLLSSFQSGRDELKASGIFQQLKDLGQSSRFDYIRRLILANLDYSDPSSPARNLLQMWITQGSMEFRRYATCLLRALLRADVPDFVGWGIDVLVTQLYMEAQVAQVALSVLEEAARELRFLRAIIQTRPKLVELAGSTLPAAGNLLLRCLACEEGLAWLAHQSMDWVSPTLRAWREEAHVHYVGQVEDKLRRGLLRSRRGGGGGTKGASGAAAGAKRHLDSRTGASLPQPVPVRVPANDCSVHHAFAHRPKAGRPGVAAAAAGNSSEGGSSSSGSGPATARWSLEWLFRLPLRIIVQLGGTTQGMKWTKNKEVFIDVDSFVDASRLRPENQREDSSESGAVCVKGIIVDARGQPAPVEVTALETMRAALCLGAVPLDANGSPEPKSVGNGGFLYTHRSTVSGGAASYGGGFGGGGGDDGGGSGGGNNRANRAVSSARGRADSTGDGDGVPSGSSIFGAPTEEQVDLMSNIWSYCTPSDREAITAANTVTGGNAVWTFKDRSAKNLGSSSASAAAAAASATGSVLLEAVEFSLALIPERSTVVTLPPHLYGELGKTVYGCEILQGTGHVEEYAALIQDPDTLPLEQRAALWAVGQLGASGLGFQLLQQCAPTVVATIADFACKSLALSLRGTSFNVLGLFCHSSNGRRALEELGWQWRCDNGAYIACPTDVTRLFQLPKREYIGSPSACLTARIPNSVPLPPKEPNWSTLLSLIGKLPCAPAKDAPQAISRMRTTDPDLFKSLGLYMHVIAMLENYSYPLNVRRSINEQLFARVPLANEAWEAIERECQQ